MLEKVLCLLGAILVSLSSSNCVDRGSNAYRDRANRSSLDASRAAAAVFERSEGLRNLRAICVQLPVFQFLTPSRTSLSREPDKIFNYYQLNEDFGRITQTLNDKLTSDGWSLFKENHGFWENQLEFRKGDIRVQVAEGHFGDENYAITCEDHSLDAREVDL